jgi:hypothetical protein
MMKKKMKMMKKKMKMMMKKKKKMMKKKKMVVSEAEEVNGFNQCSTFCLNLMLPKC